MCGSPFQSFRFFWIDFTLPRDLSEQLLLPQPSGCEDVLQGSAVLSQSSWTRLINPLPSCWFFLEIGDRPNRNQEHARSAPRVCISKWMTLMLDVPNIHGYTWIHLDQVVNTSSCIANAWILRMGDDQLTLYKTPGTVIILFARKCIRFFSTIPNLGSFGRKWDHSLLHNSPAKHFQIDHTSFRFKRTNPLGLQTSFAWQRPSNGSHPASKWQRG